jgi:signal transduction histidine kinase
MVVRSDIFQAELRRRREGRGEKVDESVREKLERVTKKALDNVEKRLDTQGQTMSVEDLRETTQMALDATGYGTSALRNSAPQTVVNVVVSQEDLARSRELMRKRSIATEAEFKEASLDGTDG